MKVLVVDDHPGMRRIAVAMLREEHQVMTAPTGSTALETVKMRTFDVVLCDYELDDMTGLEVWRRLPKHLQERFVMWTAAPGKVGEVSFEVLEKPVGGDELREAVKRAHERRKLSVDEAKPLLQQTAGVQTEAERIAFQTLTTEHYPHDRMSLQEWAHEYAVRIQEIRRARRCD